LRPTISGLIHRSSHHLIVHVGVVVTAAIAKTAVPVVLTAAVPAILDLFAGKVGIEVDQTRTSTAKRRAFRSIHAPGEGVHATGHRAIHLVVNPTTIVHTRTVEAGGGAVTVQLMN